MRYWPSWNERRNRSTNQMPGKKHLLGPPNSRTDLKEVLGDELHGWIERVIVPALVSKFLQENGCSSDGLMDNAEPMNSLAKQDAVSQLKRR